MRFVSDADVSNPSRPGWGTALAIIFGLVTIVAGVIGSRTPLTRHLPDGSTVRIAGLMYGTNVTLKEGPRRWQLAVGRRLPYFIASRLGWWFEGGGLSLGGFTNQKCFVFLVHEGIGQMPSDNLLRLIALDEHGRRYDGGWNKGTVAETDASGAHYHILEGRAIERFPPDSKTITLQFTDGTNAVASFLVSNPAYGATAH